MAKNQRSIRFCRVRQPNEKGIVEGVVKYARLNYFVPVPQVKDFDELNAYLEECCRNDLKRRVREKRAPKNELLKEDQGAMLPVPVAPFDACRKASTTVDKLSLVRFDCNDYSVPVRYAHHTVVLKGYVDGTFPSRFVNGPVGTEFRTRRCFQKGLGRFELDVCAHEN